MTISGVSVILLTVFVANFVQSVVIPCDRKLVSSLGYYDCTIPDGVYEVRITALGGAGGSVVTCGSAPCDALQGGTAIRGGASGQVVSTMMVTPGERIQVSYFVII